MTRMASSTDSIGATFRAFRAAGVDPDLAHEASEEVRTLAGQNVIAHVDARLDSFEAGVDARFAHVDARLDSLAARIDNLEQRVDTRFDSLEKRFDSLEKRFDSLEKRFDLFIHTQWALIGILAVAVLGILGTHFVP